MFRLATGDGGATGRRGAGALAVALPLLTLGIAVPSHAQAPGAPKEGSSEPGGKPDAAPSDKLSEDAAAPTGIPADPEDTDPEDADPGGADPEDAGPAHADPEGEPLAGGVEPGPTDDAGLAEIVGSDADQIEDLSLDQLLGTTVTATKTELSVDEAPSIVQVITHQDIRRRGYRTVADALQHVPGMFVLDDHLYQNVGVRGVVGATGSANDIVKVMVNGQPISFRSTAVNFLEQDLIPIEAVERIEVIRGPASALYGANAFLGVINIITFTGAEDQAKGRESHGIALDGYYMQTPHNRSVNGTASFFTGGEHGDFRFFLSGVIHREDRSGLEVPGLDDIIRFTQNRENPDLFDPPERAPSPGWDDDARLFMLREPISRSDVERTASVYGTSALSLGDEAELELDGHFQWFDRHAEWQDFTFLTHDSRLTHVNGFGRLRFSFGEDRAEGFSMNASVAVAGGSPTNREHIVDRLVSNQFKRRDIGYLALDATAEARYTFGPADLLIVGVDYTHDLEDLLRMQTFNDTTGSLQSVDPGFGADGDKTDELFANLGVYGQWMWNPWDKLVLTLGARVDYNTAIACNGDEWDCLGSRDDETVQATPTSDPFELDNQGGAQLSSRAAAVYKFPWRDLYAKVIYGSSFKPPSPFQLYHRQQTITGSTVGNPGLLPQTADTIEGAIGLRPVPWLNTSVVGFFTSVHDVVVFFKEDQVLEPRNADVTASGIEANIAVDWERTVSLFLNGSFLLDTSLEPKRKRDETQAAFERSPLNDDVETGRHPDLMINGGVNFHFPEQHLNANLTVRYVGNRRASLINNQLHNRALDNTYQLDGYVLTDLTVSSVGLTPFGGRETIFSASVRGVPGGFVEPGSGGIDIPSRSARIMLRMEQRL